MRNSRAGPPPSRHGGSYGSATRLPECVTRSGCRSPPGQTCAGHAERDRQIQYRHPARPRLRDILRHSGINPTEATSDGRHGPAAYVIASVRPPPCLSTTRASLSHLTHIHRACVPRAVPMSLESGRNSGARQGRLLHLCRRPADSTCRGAGVHTEEAADGAVTGEDPTTSVPPRTSAEDAWRDRHRLPGRRARSNAHRQWAACRRGGED